MEFRGKSANEPSKGRTAIARRSCDQCRARKTTTGQIGCDRGSPCSNCIPARLECTHTAVASNAATPKQRVLVSAQYEQKIDGIVLGIDGIKSLLEELNLSTDKQQPEKGFVPHLNRPDSARLLIESQATSTFGGESPWDYSSHIIDFVKAVVGDRGSGEVDGETGEVLSSLKTLVQTLESPPTAQDLHISDTKVLNHQVASSMPPLNTVVVVLRWAKEHEGFTRIAWISQILPLQKFAEICQKVYFAVDNYSELDLILANGDYCELCRSNFYSALSRLPLLLPESMEVIALLTLAAVNAIEKSKAAMAWSFISVASNLCQTLGYHRLCTPGRIDKSLRAAQERLFWSVYNLDRGISLRLARSSNICDAEITLLEDPDEARPIRLGRIQGKVYDQLYSPVGLSRTDGERGNLARKLARDLQELIKETHDEILNASGQPNDCEMDPMRVVYLQCDLVCQSSLVVLILRAIPTAQGLPNGVSDNCVAAARDALNLHEKCMISVRGCKTDPFVTTKYINWAIVHTPFVAFSILFTHAVQRSDFADLAILDRFATSLEPEDASSESITHPHRLYKLLCKAARLYIESKTPSSPMGLAVAHSLPDISGEFDFSHFETEAGAAANEPLEAGNLQTHGLSDWFYSNQQMMSLLDEDAMF